MPRVIHTVTVRGTDTALEEMIIQWCIRATREREYHLHLQNRHFQRLAQFDRYLSDGTFGVLPEGAQHKLRALPDDLYELHVVLPRNA